MKTCDVCNKEVETITPYVDGGEVGFCSSKCGVRSLENAYGDISKELKKEMANPFKIFKNLKPLRNGGYSVVTLKK